MAVARRVSILAARSVTYVPHPEICPLKITEKTAAKTEENGAKTAAAIVSFCIVSPDFRPRMKAFLCNAQHATSVRSA